MHLQDVYKRQGTDWSEPDDELPFPAGVLPWAGVPPGDAGDVSGTDGFSGTAAVVSRAAVVSGCAGLAVPDEDVDDAASVPPK